MCGASANLYGECTPAMLRQQFMQTYVSNALQRAPRCNSIDSAKRKRSQRDRQEHPSRSSQYKKVRLKMTATIKWTSSLFLALMVFMYIFGMVMATRGVNRPPKFLLEGQSEIVLRLKEGPETPIGK